MSEEDFKHDLFSGLKSLSESAFPKVCSSCGKRYESAEEFLKDTKSINKEKSGLKVAEEDDGQFIVEVFRNCTCGSTLMDFFSDRRDNSERGIERRERFSSLLEKLEGKGIETSVGRNELLKVMRGQRSELLDKLLGAK